MRASLRTRASEFAQEFDGELTRVYVAFHVGSDQLDADAAAALADAYARWQAGAKIPALVSAVYMADGKMLDTAELRRLDPATRTLTPIAWPPELSAALARTHQGLPQVVGGPPSAPSMLFADAIDSRTPALLIAVPRFKRSTENGRIRFISDPAAGARLVIVTLDAESAAASAAGAAGGQVLRRRQRLGVPRHDRAVAVRLGAAGGKDEIVYNSAPTPIEASKADVTAGLFDLRMDELTRLVDEGARGGPPPPSARMSIAIVRRSNGADGRHVLVAGGEPHGAWEMRLSHRTGSLDTHRGAVAAAQPGYQSRRARAAGGELRARPGVGASGSSGCRVSRWNSSRPCRTNCARRSRSSAPRARISPMASSPRRRRSSATAR